MKKYIIMFIMWTPDSKNTAVLGAHLFQKKHSPVSTIQTWENSALKNMSSQRHSTGSLKRHACGNMALTDIWNQTTTAEKCARLFRTCLVNSTHLKNATILSIYQVQKHVFQPSLRKYSEKKMFSSSIMIFAIRSCAIFM